MCQINIGGRGIKEKGKSQLGQKKMVRRAVLDLGLRTLRQHQQPF